MNNQKKTIRLGVNIDHVATVREVRGVDYPDPIEAANLAELGGADGITLHVREDRRHMQEEDLRRLRENSPDRYINLEIATTSEMIAMAKKHKPQACCLVPEKREELTTEGGLNVLKYHKEISLAVYQLNAEGIEVSLFIEANQDQIRAAQQSGAQAIELHTGDLAHALSDTELSNFIQSLDQAAECASSLDLKVNAGHGLHYKNVHHIINLSHLNELNIGHAIVARALMVGFEQAVREMKNLLL